MQRLAQLQNWLARHYPDHAIGIEPASADASFRRYFRVRIADATDTLIAMDAPPAHEDCGPWLKVAGLFAEAGVHVPRVLASDAAQGFILMSDLGSRTYLDALTAENAHGLYADALGSLIAIQHASRPGVLPEYSREMLLREMRLFPEWYIGRHIGVDLDDAQITSLEAIFQRIADVNLAEPQVFVHRDYHCRNLMHLAEGGNPGIIDFQDAVYGPLSYDLVSLFKDAYIRWDEEFVLDQLVRYWDAARKLGLPVRTEFGDFLRDFEWMGVQRHLKVLGIFARLHHRDGKDGYLKDLPLVLDYLRRTCLRYGELKPLLRLIERLHPDAVATGYTF